MWIGLLALAGIVFAYFLLQRLTQPNKNSSENALSFADIPAKVDNPAQYAGIRSVIAWEFLAPNLSTACPFARNHDRIHMQTSDCTPLPLPDCDATTCQCHYRPLTGQRRNHRRMANERRATYRMDSSDDNTDRRKALSERRKGGTGWSDDHSP